ncbi:MAG: hypothetical protein IPK09_00075 [Candidatus Competibacteraceae bacterium]|nr:hypothetical protein [Candidatus Competibacteraceae bacterium]
MYRHQDSAWYELGAAVGIGGLAKFSIGLLPFFLGVGFVLMPAGRRVGRWPPGVACCWRCWFSQVLLWNAAHGWPMLHHEQSHVLNVTEEGGWEENAGDLLEFLGGQWLALSPLVAVALLRALARPPRPAEQRWLWGFAKATVSKVQLNWPAPAYIGLLLLLAGRIDGLTDRWRRWVVAGVASSVLLLVVAFSRCALG